MLETLETISWKQLHHAYGTAEDTPRYLKQLLSEDEQIFEEAYMELTASLFHQTTLYEATVYAIPYIIEILTVTAHPIHQRDILHWMITAGSCKEYAYPEERQHAHYLQFGNYWQDPDILRHCHEKLDELIPLLVEMYPRLADEARALIPAILAGYKERADTLIPYLQTWLISELITECQSSIWYCLGVFAP